MSCWAEVVVRLMVMTSEMGGADNAGGGAM